MLICNVCQRPTSLYHTKRARFFIFEQSSLNTNKSENKKGLLNSELMTSQPGHRTLDVMPKKKVKKSKNETGLSTLEWKIDMQPIYNMRDAEIKQKIKQEEIKIKQDIEMIDKVVSEFEEQIINKAKLESDKTENIQPNENIITQGDTINSVEKGILAQFSEGIKTNFASNESITEKKSEIVINDTKPVILSTELNEIKLNEKINSSEIPTKSLYDLFS